MLADVPLARVLLGCHSNSRKVFKLVISVFMKLRVSDTSPRQWIWLRRIQ